jgi:hypothetical protein
MEKRDEETPGRSRNPQPHGDGFGQPDAERQRKPGQDRDIEEEDEGLE